MAQLGFLDISQDCWMRKGDGLMIDEVVRACLRGELEHFHMSRVSTRMRASSRVRESVGSTQYGHEKDRHQEHECSKLFH